ncbi:MAG: BatA and WFA domain-containing protein [Capsulimonadaceae bacterium]|nr:BatA and WFA domain-containing protein [Capsulimonadaceae bacterium]
MNYLSPLNLLWLFPILGGIALLWMLRMRRHDQVVSSLALWRAITPVQKADTPFQRLRTSLILFLQLLIAFLLIAALAGPLFVGRGQGRRAVVVVIDNSAGMRATDAAPSRLDGAKSLAGNALGGRMRDGDRVCVVVTSPVPHVSLAWTTSRTAARQAIDAVPFTDAPRDLAGTLAVAAAQFAPSSPDARSIVVCTDGAWDPDDDAGARLSSGDVPIEVLALPLAVPRNAGIVALSARADPITPGRMRVFVRVLNASPTQLRDAYLSATLDGKPIGRYPAAARPNAEATVAFTVSPPSHESVLRVAMQNVGSDALESDNRASLVLPRGGPRRILLVSAGDSALERAVLANANIALFGCPPSGYNTVDVGQYDLVIFDRYAPLTLPPCNSLIIDAFADGGPAIAQQGQGPAGELPVIDWSGTHPLLRFVDFGAVHVARQALAAPAAGARTLAETSAGPVILASDAGGRRLAWVGFSPADSDFTGVAAFPIFVENALEWLGAGMDTVDAEAIGTPFAIPGHAGRWSFAGPGGGASGQCTEPSGAGCSVDPNVISAPGVYIFRYGGATHFLARSVVNEHVTDLRARDHPALRAIVRRQNTSQAFVPSSLAPWAAVGALLLLLLEWGLYHSGRIRQRSTFP